MSEEAAKKEMGGKAEEIQPALRQGQAETEISDIEDDPHRAALELNPEVAQKLTWSAFLAVFVSRLSY